MSLKEFIATVKTEGVARPNRFRVDIMVPTSLSPYVQAPAMARRLNLYCESANFPAQSIGVRQQRIYGPNYQRPYNVDYGGEGMTMTFNLDRDMKIKAFFDAWMGQIIDPIQYFAYHQKHYISNRIIIEQLDEQDRVKYGISIEDAFPRSMSLLELNQSSQNQVHKLNVTFAYRRWIPMHSITTSVAYPKVLPARKIVANPSNPTGKSQASYLDDWYNTVKKQQDNTGDVLEINP